MTFTEEETNQMIDECVTAAKIALLKQLRDDSYENINQIRGAIHGHLELLGVEDE